MITLFFGGPSGRDLEDLESVGVNISIYAS